MQVVKLSLPAFSLFVSVGIAIFSRANTIMVQKYRYAINSKQQGIIMNCALRIINQQNYSVLQIIYETNIAKFNQHLILFWEFHLTTKNQF